MEDKYTEDEKITLRENIKKEKLEIKRYKYIGETSRSIYERARNTSWAYRPLTRTVTCSSI